MRILGIVLLILGILIVALGKPVAPSLALGLPIGFVGLMALTSKAKKK